MNAITLLKADHDEVKGMLSELEPTTERAVKTRTELFAKISLWNCSLYYGQCVSHCVPCGCCRRPG